MKILAVETATGMQSVAVMDGATVLARSDHDAAGSHARWLVPTIHRLLRDCGMMLRALEGCAVSIGPGSFTGLRVGLATLKGFRAVTGFPIAPVPTLEAMAWNLPDETRTLCPILKARTGEVYWAVFRWEQPGRLARLSEDRVGSLAALANSLDGPAVVFGAGWVENRAEFLGLFQDRPDRACEAPASAMAASAVSVGLAGRDRLSRGESAAQDAAPRYVQRAEAELKWEQAQKSRV